MNKVKDSIFLTNKPDCIAVYFSLGANSPSTHSKPHLLTKTPILLESSVIYFTFVHHQNTIEHDPYRWKSHFRASKARDCS